MKVTLAYPYTAADGSAHEPDSTPDLPDSEAVRLLETGRARTADASTAKSGASKEKN